MSSQKYEKLSHEEHIKKLPETYIGSIEENKEELWYVNREKEMMEKKELTFIPGEYKLFDEKNLKWYLLRKAMIKDLDISIDEKAIDKFIKEAIEKNESQKDEIKRFYKKESNKSKLSDDLLDQQILDMLKEHSKIKEKDTNTADLQAGHNNP